jgi:hypothetical protein
MDLHSPHDKIQQPSIPFPVPMIKIKANNIFNNKPIALSKTAFAIFTTEQYANKVK